VPHLIGRKRGSFRKRYRESKAPSKKKGKKKSCKEGGLSKKGSTEEKEHKRGSGGKKGKAKLLGEKEVPLLQKEKNSQKERGKR